MDTPYTLNVSFNYAEYYNLGDSEDKLD